MNTDLYPHYKAKNLPEDADEHVEQFVYMESDRSVRKELSSYRKEIME